MLSLLNMPKVELQTFSADPLEYHQFIMSFDQNVHNLPCNSDLKLTRLMQYTVGPAKDAIRNCQLIGGDTGYRKASTWSMRGSETGGV